MMGDRTFAPMMLPVVGRIRTQWMITSAGDGAEYWIAIEIIRSSPASSAAILFDDGGVYCLWWWVGFARSG